MSSFTTSDASFGDALKAAGWEEVIPFAKFRKGDWIIVFDTSGWMELGTVTTPRVIDVPVPEDRLVGWTLNLINHLLETNDALAGATPPSV
jgi:hypothetical protein